MKLKNKAIELTFLENPYTRSLLDSVMAFHLLLMYFSDMSENRHSSVFLFTNNIMSSLKKV